MGWRETAAEITEGRGVSYKQWRIVREGGSAINRADIVSAQGIVGVFIGRADTTLVPPTPTLIKSAGESEGG